MEREDKEKLLGKYALLKAEVLKPEFRDLMSRVILVGYGAFSPEKWIDKDNVPTASVNHLQCWDWDDIERLATEQEIEASGIKKYVSFKEL